MGYIEIKKEIEANSHVSTYCFLYCCGLLLLACVIPGVSIQASKPCLLSLFPHGTSFESWGVTTLSFKQFALTFVPLSSSFSISKSLSTCFLLFSQALFFIVIRSRLFHFLFFLVCIDLSLQMKLSFNFFVTSIFFSAWGWLIAYWVHQWYCIFIKQTFMHYR